MLTLSKHKRVYLDCQDDVQTYRAPVCRSFSKWTTHDRYQIRNNTHYGSIGEVWRYKLYYTLTRRANFDLIIAWSKSHESQ